MLADRILQGPLFRVLFYVSLGEKGVCSHSRYTRAVGGCREGAEAINAFQHLPFVRVTALTVTQNLPGPAPLSVYFCCARCAPRSVSHFSSFFPFSLSLSLFPSGSKLVFSLSLSVGPVYDVCPARVSRSDQALTSSRIVVVSFQLVISLESVLHERGTFTRLSRTSKLDQLNYISLRFFFFFLLFFLSE